jgi:hypothetical protein
MLAIKIAAKFHAKFLHSDGKYAGICRVAIVSLDLLQLR